MTNTVLIDGLNMRRSSYQLFVYAKTGKAIYLLIGANSIDFHTVSNKFTREIEYTH